MPLRRSQHGFSRAIWTIRNGMQVGRMAVKGVKAVRKYMQKRKQRQPARAVAKVREKLALRNPLYANKKLYRKDTPAGQKRRAVFAANLKKNPIPRKAKSKTGDLSRVATPGGFYRKPYSGKIALKKGMTGRQLHQGVIRHVVKKYTASEVKKAGGDRKLAAKNIKALRKQPGGADHISMTLKKPAVEYARRAASQYHKTFGQKRK